MFIHTYLGAVSAHTINTNLKCCHLQAIPEVPNQGRMDSWRRLCTPWVKMYLQARQHCDGGAKFVCTVVGLISKASSVIES